MASTDVIIKYFVEVDKLMEKQYGVTFTEFHSLVELFDYYTDQWTPQKFVTYQADKYELSPLLTL